MVVEFCCDFLAIELSDIAPGDRARRTRATAVALDDVVVQLLQDQGDRLDHHGCDPFEAGALLSTDPEFDARSTAR